jgi:hypothetical protein
MNSNDLRDYLSATLKGIQNDSISLDKAKAMSDVIQVAINLAKVEVDFVKANGGGKSSFFIQNTNHFGQTPTGNISSIGNITTHTLRG